MHAQDRRGQTSLSARALARNADLDRSHERRQRINRVHHHPDSSDRRSTDHNSRAAINVNDILDINSIVSLVVLVGCNVNLNIIVELGTFTIIKCRMTTADAACRCSIVLADAESSPASSAMCKNKNKNNNQCL